jgi:hypothetical protein
LSFAPYWAGGREGIIHHVIKYKSYFSSFFYKLLVPEFFQVAVSSRLLWVGMLVLFGFICRTRKGFESLLIYCGALVAFSPAMANQYLAIPAALIAVFPSVPFAIYTAIAVLHLCADQRDGPHPWAGLNGRYDDMAICALCFALAWLFWRPQFLQLFQKIRREVEIQLELGP